MDTDELRMMELMDGAAETLREVLPKDQYMDDLKWGKHRFEIPIFEDLGMGRDGVPKTRYVQTFQFYYDSDDVFERTADEQLTDALEDFIRDYC